MEKKRRGPWLHLIEQETEVLSLPLECMACRMFSFDNQQSTTKEYLAAIKFFHVSYVRRVATGKDIASRFRGVSGKQPLR